MSLPLGHRVDGEFVCMDCIDPRDHKPTGIGSGYSAVDQRVGSGEECSRCGRRMPYLATVRLLPDGWSSARSPIEIPQTEKIVRLEREEKVLIDGHALVYVDIGCQREVGLTVTPHGKIAVWIHDDLYNDEAEPVRWTYDPTSSPPEV